MNKNDIGMIATGFGIILAMFGGCALINKYTDIRMKEIEKVAKEFEKEISNNN